MKPILTSSFIALALAAFGQGQVCAVMSPISAAAGQPVGQLQLQVGGPSPTILNLPNGGGCLDLSGQSFPNGTQLMPYKNINWMNGVSTFDLVKISKHILGTGTFTTCYQLLAADVNKNGAVTVFDLVTLRAIVLGIPSAVPPGQTSWRFIPKNCADPCAGGCPACTFGNATNADCTFYAIKVGDLTGDADPDNLIGTAVEDRSPAHFSIEDRPLSAGEEATVPIFLDEGSSLLGWQMSMGFDPDFIEIKEAQPNVADASGSDPMVVLTEPGHVAMNWFSASPQRFMAARDALIFLKIKALRDCWLADVLFLDNAGLRPEAYSDEEKSQPVELVFSKNKPATTASGLTAWPNPFTEKTTLAWSQAEPGEAVIEVFDATGRRIFYQKTWGEKAGNSLLLGGFGEGLFLARVAAGGQVFSTKIVGR